MMLATCPCCGYDLEALSDFTVGDLSVESGALVKWRGKGVSLTPSERLLVIALAKAGGAIMTRATLADVTGNEGDNPGNIISVWICRINRAFRVIDPAFDAIETVWRAGIRWRAQELQAA